MGENWWKRVDKWGFCYYLKHLTIHIFINMVAMEKSPEQPLIYWIWSWKSVIWCNFTILWLPCKILHSNLCLPSILSSFKWDFCNLIRFSVFTRFHDKMEICNYVIFLYIPKYWLLGRAQLSCTMSFIKIMILQSNLTLYKFCISHFSARC